MAKREQSGCGGARAAAAAAAREQVCGVVERVSYHDEASQFTVARLRCDEGGASSERAVGGGGGGGGARAAVTIVGRMPALQEGEWVQCEGRFVDDPQWGRQFQVTSCEVASPTTAHGIQRYLGSGLVKGVGPELARRIVERFGERTLQVLETEPERLREVEGIGRKRQRQLIEAWNEHRALRRIMVFLRGHGIGAAHAMRVWRSYGEAAIERVRENPYRLAAEIWGIGFGTADRLARALGVPADAPARAEAGLRHALERAADEGHVCVPRQELLVRATELLGVGTEGLEQALDRLVAAGAVRQEAPGSSGPHVYLCHLHAAECGLAERLAALQRAPSALPPIRVPEAIAWVEQRRGVVLAPSQRHALALALGSKVCVVTGGPGVGKTTIVACLLEIVRAKRGRVRLAAPTGRAAKRLQEATGHEAMTVHRLLRWNPRARDFEYGPEHPLPDCDLLVLDETSMVDVLLMHRLLLALPAAAHLVLVGDRDQLPSVGPGSVLADIIASGAVPVARLTEVHRQAAGSAIVAGAHAVNRGELPALRELGAGADLCFVEAGRPELALAAICDLVARVLPGRFGLDPVRDIQVLAPMHRGACGVQAINERLGEVLRPAGAAGGGVAGRAIVRQGRRFARGTKVIQLRNDYDRDVYNGDIGVVARVDPEQDELEVAFDDRRLRYAGSDLDQLDLAFAVSIHKSQGSEYPCVVVPLLTQHYMMLQRNLLYTAITRGRRLAVLVGQRRAVVIAVRNDRTQRRGSFLDVRLAAAVAAGPGLVAGAGAPARAGPGAAGAGGAQ